MSETFNPHEILSRIRSKSGQLISTTTPTPTQNVQPSNHVNPPPSNASPTKTVKSTSPMPATGLKSMKSSPTLLLTPSQRQDNINMRNELEGEIKRLRDEVMALKNENKQLRHEKLEIEKNFEDYRLRSEDTIVKLRSKIAKSALLGPTASLSNNYEGTGRMYPPQNSKSSSKSYNSYNYPPPPPPGPLESFRDPTFSELMRRSTPIHQSFENSLRRGSNKTGLTPTSPVYNADQNNNNFENNLNNNNESNYHTHSHSHSNSQSYNFTNSTNYIQEDHKFNFHDNRENNNNLADSTTRRLSAHTHNFQDSIANDVPILEVDLSSN